jgi:hypothetical protein
VLSLGANHLGRATDVDWMIVGTIILRVGGLTAEPGAREFAAGILVHQTFDFLWTMLFFIPLGRWTRDLAPAQILLLAVPWALLTSATEYFLWLPWAQPLFVMQQPYWPGLGAHVISASLYPLFPWLRDVLTGRRSHWRRFAHVWIGLAVVGSAARRGSGLAATSRRTCPCCPAIRRPTAAFCA